MPTRNIQYLQKLLAEAEEHRDHYEEVAQSIRKTIKFAESHEVSAGSTSAPIKELRNAMWEILKDEGKPLHYKEIHKRLVSRRVQVTGKDPARNVGAHLSNDDRFASLGSGRWGLVDWSKKTKAAKPPNVSRQTADSHSKDESEQPVAFVGYPDPIGSLDSVDLNEIEQEFAAEIEREYQDDFADVPF